MVTDLNQLAETLLTEARDASNGVVSRTIVHGERQRTTLMAILAGHALGEHNAPPAATLQLLSGRATLHAEDDTVELQAGQLVAIPPRRHDLAAAEDSVAILTVAID